jgi:hypothetical protein
MALRQKTSSVLGLLAGILATVFGRGPAKPAAKDLKDAEFSTSTQRLGVRFTERIRDVFRFKWLISSKR